MKQHQVLMIQYGSFWMARVLAPIAGRSKPLSCLKKSSGLVYLANIERIAIKWQVV